MSKPGPTAPHGDQPFCNTALKQRRALLIRFDPATDGLAPVQTGGFTAAPSEGMRKLVAAHLADRMAFLREV